MHFRNRGTEVLHGFASENRTDRTCGRQGGSAQMAIKESGRPGIACASGVDYATGAHRFDPMQVFALRNPSAVRAHLDRSDAAKVGDFTGEDIIVVTALE